MMYCYGFRKLALSLSLSTMAIWLALGPAQSTADEASDKASAAARVLTNHCVTCHSGDDPKGGLNLRTREAMLQGGESGTSLIPGSATRSLLIERIQNGEMPPEGRTPLTAPEIELLEAWIDAGANVPSNEIPLPDEQEFEISAAARAHWAFQPLQPASIPLINTNSSRVRTPIDAFIAARLDAAGLTFSPDADQRALIRRVYLDLIGLPPSPADVESFVADGSPDAYERLLDRLLASPQFGERWGRQWLDGAGYADVIGMDNDAGIISTGENKWLYRDYVIGAFNRDKPFDLFLTEQIAGDELANWRDATTFTPQIREQLIATGFLRNSADDTASGELNTPLIQHGILQRTGEVLINNLLGITLNCAKCHNHKYEPISQRDYYRVMAVLQPAFNPASWLQPDKRQLPDVAPAEKAAADANNAQLDMQIVELQRQLDELKSPYQQSLASQKLAALPEPIRSDTKTAVETAADQRNEIQKFLAGKFEESLKVKPEEIAAALTTEERAKSDALAQQIGSLSAERRTWQHLQVVYDVGPPTATHLLKRGNVDAPAEEVSAGFPEILCTATSNTTEAPAVSIQTGPTSSGRRLALAHWLTKVDSPAGALVLRVRVNRIWQQLFHRGIVETADNFGLSGSPPTHPELLEFLADRFVRMGEHHKPFLKSLMLSTVYRQASYCADDSLRVRAMSVDPDNRLLWRMPLRRLESEVIRDSILAASGDLNSAIGGPSIPVQPQADGTFTIQREALQRPGEAMRRSVYLLARRNYHPTMLSVFDQPNMAANCSRRADSAVVLQSLTLLNDSFVLSQADQCAQHILRDSGSDLTTCIDAAFRRILSRQPTAGELADCTQVLAKHIQYYSEQAIPNEQCQQKALAHLCQVLLNTSEFLYIP